MKLRSLNVESPRDGKGSKAPDAIPRSSRPSWKHLSPLLLAGVFMVRSIEAFLDTLDGALRLIGGNFSWNVSVGKISYDALRALQTSDS